MSGSGKRKPLIKAKKLEWVQYDSFGEVQRATPSLVFDMEINNGSLRILARQGTVSYVLFATEFGGKGKTERAKSCAQKWWNRFIRSLRSGLEVTVE